MANAKLTSAVSNRERLNAQQFAEAGRKPLERTFKKNPLLAQSAKNRWNDKYEGIIFDENAALLHEWMVFVY